MFPPGGTGIAGFNGCGKSTLLKLAAGGRTPETGLVGRNGSTCFCRQECDVPPPELTEQLAATDFRACEIRCRFGLEAGWGERWESLSFGERKRARPGCAFYAEPDILCLDEPTNWTEGRSQQEIELQNRGRIRELEKTELRRMKQELLHRLTRERWDIRDGILKTGYRE
ncbi:ATP-binding cassette domain-containing protein [Victivallis vadensis]|uniref:ATP-binding cassette domain-containing protein n=1 Tax=Victivallis vadensis TaxID=172901 RepID=UPI0023F26268|nr:ATP-binding cassette domain-containing protein [Victivallis vadensis]